MACLENGVSTASNQYSYDNKVKKENRVLKDKLDELLATITDNKRLIMSLEENNFQLTTEIDQMRKANQRIQRETQKIIDEMVQPNSCKTSCPSFDLCKKRILLVGGITKMESLYKELIEKSGGVFEYHDGYVKKGIKSLKCRLKRADIVFCPVDCNSHGACTLVKQLGKKYQKPVKMLPGSGLATILNSIQKISHRSYQDRKNYDHDPSIC